LFVIVVGMIVAFLAKDMVFGRIILAPLDDSFVLYRGLQWLLTRVGLPAPDAFSMELINIDLAAQFFIHLKISFWAGFVVSIPYILYLLWGFLAPALYASEKRAVKGAFLFGGGMFLVGLLMAYFLIFPLTLRFLGTYQVSETVANQISLQSYIAMFIRLCLMMGLVFEMPTLAAVLSRIGVLTRAWMKQYRKHAVVVLLILAAVITPTGDAFTLCLVGIPMYLLYELSILVCKK
jgi:sec-independent protein translocase protein TatC